LFKLAIPLLHVSNSTAAEDFYCNQLGFQREFAHHVDDAKPDPCYMGLMRDGVRLHVSSFSGDGISGGVVNLMLRAWMRSTRNSSQRASELTRDRLTRPGVPEKCM